MPEQRSQRHHRDRLNVAIREELGAILEGELGDPRIGLASVNEVHLAPDSRSARIFIRVDGDDEEAERTLEGLAAARGFIRHQLAENLGLRHPPELVFILDRSEQFGARIEELLQRTHKKGTKRR